MSETHGLSGVARLLGRLLLREIDDAFAERLSRPDIADGLAALGLDLSRFPLDNPDAMAADYFEAILHPHTYPPPVQSLWEDGRYESSAAADVAAVAAACGVDFDGDQARGVPQDHLGAELLLWAELEERSSSAAAFAVRHLAWACRPLEQMAAAGGFYGEVAQVVRRFIVAVTPSEADASHLG